MATYIPGPAYSWESQSVQYAYRDEPGINLERHSVGVVGSMYVIDCLLYRDDEGLLLGILNYYVNDNPEEKAGNVNIFIHPKHKRQGIATALLTEAAKRWVIDVEQQNFTPEGIRLLDGLIKKGLVT